MIKYEFGTLVLDSSHSKSDQAAIDAFVSQAVDTERSRIYKRLVGYTDQDSLSIAKFKIAQIINNGEGQ